MKIKKVFTLAILLSFFVACSNDKEKDQSDMNASVQSSLSQSENLRFNLNLIDGNSIFIKKDNENLNFADGDKATLFVFFTTWCSPCIAEIPHLNKLQEKYEEQFNIVGVLLEDKSDEELRAFAQKNQILYKIANGENNYLLAKILGGVNGIPTMFLYDKNSQLINQYLGLIPEEMLEIDIQKAVL
ncbi:TPA: TlpA family protein disulfide reductase [Campylobacter coli]|nr:TlpA family protein disulfide reductase [Campylobacter coli]